MDLEQIIRELRARRKYLDWIIATLESLEITNPVQPKIPKSGAKRRGRKFMNDEERRQVSERMKRYWSTRKASKTTTENPRQANLVSHELPDGRTVSGKSRFVLPE
jgi:hypothetical protein